MSDTPAPGVFPPEGTKPETSHWLNDRLGRGVLFIWDGQTWTQPGQEDIVSPIALALHGFSYSHANSKHQPENDRADAERFRWLVENRVTHGLVLHGLEFLYNGSDIRASIDEAMGRDRHDRQGVERRLVMLMDISKSAHLNNMIEYQYGRWQYYKSLFERFYPSDVAWIDRRDTSLSDLEFDAYSDYCGALGDLWTLQKETFNARSA